MKSIWIATGIIHRSNFRRAERNTALSDWSLAEGESGMTTEGMDTGVHGFLWGVESCLCLRLRLYNLFPCRYKKNSVQTSE